MTDEERQNTWIASSHKQAEEWALVLAAAGVPHRLKKTSQGWALSVPWRDEERAARELEAFQQETAGASTPAHTRAEYGTSRAGLALAVALVLFFWVTGPRDLSVIWFRVGSASAAWQKGS